MKQKLGDYVKRASMRLGRQRQVLLLTALVLFVIGIAGFGVHLVSTDDGPAGVPVAQARRANFPCPAGDSTKTSALTVTHHTAPSYLGTSTVVEPDVGETWTIVTYWEDAADNPYWTQSAVTASWNGSQWALSNTALGGGVAAIGVCQGDTCDAGGEAVHSWKYKLIVDVQDPYSPGGITHHLWKVVYTTTSVANGYTIEDPGEVQGDCYLDDSVSPTSQAFAATDEAPYWDSNRCPYNCFTAGASVTIEYD